MQKVDDWLPRDGMGEQREAGIKGDMSKFGGIILTFIILIVLMASYIYIYIYQNLSSCILEIYATYYMLIIPQ